MTNPSGLAPLTSSGDARFPGSPVLSEDFTGTTLPSTFWPYAGKSGDTEEGGQVHVWWMPSHVYTVGDSMARLQTSWEGGGTWPKPPQSMLVNAGIGTVGKFLYGAFFIRMQRFFNEGNDHVIELLMPGGGVWPPEVDIREDGGSNYDVSATLHFAPNNQTIQDKLPGIDLTQWHTWGVMWSPGQLDYVLDGVIWDSVTSAEVPNIAMWLGIQSEYEGPVLAVDPHLPQQVRVDWITVFAYTPASAPTYGEPVYALINGVWALAGYTEVADPTGGPGWHAS